MPFFFKQWGEWHPMVEGDWLDDRLCTYLLPDGSEHREPPGGDDSDEPWELVARVGKKAAGALLDGREWRKFPEIPQLQEAASA